MKAHGVVYISVANVQERNDLWAEFSENFRISEEKTGRDLTTASNEQADDLTS